MQDEIICGKSFLNTFSELKNFVTIYYRNPNCISSHYASSIKPLKTVNYAIRTCSRHLSSDESSFFIFNSSSGISSVSSSLNALYDSCKRQAQYIPKRLFTSAFASESFSLLEKGRKTENLNNTLNRFLM